ncbi:2-polyprenyl-6-methoxyphenol hydroxylase [Chishuiella changwenlii]|uniref:Flavin-dependent monooxygenase n=1 Tax=Chishuiella changwenlii TaxID=1434701 RepID=A0A1M6T6G5_9FLAO|nr:NAD(P)/FAD-dependent oxidoreductase [Chishuiella changwenlii]GGE95022.1 tetracycline resistance protein [Chishuiella changwenlii]SHK52577.1 2-polyprenyl-6-methoxyphenol hydroxylase [Chishuiella changwenlii]
MKLQDKKVAIIGGGPGGLTLARLLQQKGVNVNVYERDYDKNARVQGSPLDLHQDSGLAAIIKADLLEEFKANFMLGADRTKIMNDKGDVVFDEDHKSIETNFDDPYFRPEIDRGQLRKILLASLREETVHWNKHFISMDKHNDGWLLNFKDDIPVYVDIVIGADGANSKIRSYITDTKAIYSGVTMIEGTIYDAEKHSPVIYKKLNGGKIMAFGNKKNILIGQKGNGEIGFYLSLKVDEDWIKNSKLNFSNKTEILNWFRGEYKEWDKSWEELVENTTESFIPRSIGYMPLNQNWETISNLTLIGDAAHVMPPFAGEGVNMAMLDALKLSEKLTAIDAISVKDAISNYESEMRKRAAIITKESIENGEKMHNENSLEIMLRFFTEHK